VDLRRRIDGGRCARHYRWFDKRNCAKRFASAKTTDRLHITGGEGHDGIGTGVAVGISTRPGTGIAVGIATSPGTGCCTALGGCANSNSASADGVEQPNLAMHDKRAKNIFR
jgi:hypothetical protein